MNNNPVLRHQKLLFYGVPSTGTAGYVFKRMKYFTELEHSKNPEEYERKYVDEPNKRTDVTGFSPEFSYGFDFHRDDSVIEDILNITNKELLGSLAVRPLLLVDTKDGSALMRDYSVIPDSEGEDENVYTYSGTFKACGELSEVTATSADDWKTVSISNETGG